ncbi:hypothetical protein [Geodermatophilus marinus]|uniref:hypothetical protein n=1 Tax=Geodermatophilus sp. LHW52908 TaxID=2303986 RepID=UPI000E3DD306|nr:hypothetical protein [Geodermatophilus sp. LHW52908]RFU22357.1 hypothetical protein D0Z06_06865 [Geodermatophilus sp. LHW52908]
MPVASRPGLVRGAASVLGLSAVLACLVLATAGPAAAVDDPTRPDARVTQGPSCRPGGVAVEVTAGTAPYAVRLGTTRAPEGEDGAELTPGAVVVLATGPVAWGETIDPFLEYTALDGSGTAYVDELEGFSFTRPAEEDCAAISPPSAAAGVPGAAVDTPPVVVPSPRAEPAPMPSPQLPPPAGAAPAGALDAPDVRAASPRVLPGGAVDVRGSGFEPGETVSVLGPGGAVLASATADAAGAVAVSVPVPDAAAPGPAVLVLVGEESDASGEVALRVADRATPLVGGGLAWVPLTAGVLLLAAGAGLAVRSARRRPPAGPPGSA